MKIIYQTKERGPIQVGEKIRLKKDSDKFSEAMKNWWGKQVFTLIFHKEDKIHIRNSKGEEFINLAATYNDIERAI